MTNPKEPNFALLYEELRQAIDGGSESMTHEDALATVKVWSDSYAQKQYPVADAQNAARYRWLLSHAYVGIAPYPKPHEVWCLRLPNPAGVNNLDDAIDAAMKGKK